MYLSARETMLIILVIAMGTFLTRSLPFILFPEGKKIPSYINYLGKVLPYAMIGLLVIYCLRSTTFTGILQGKASFVPEGLAILSIVILHRWKDNTLISIAGGTVVYMILVQTIFRV